MANQTGVTDVLHVLGGQEQMQGRQGWSCWGLMSTEIEISQQAAAWAKWETAHLGHPKYLWMGALEEIRVRSRRNTNTRMKRQPSTPFWTFLPMVPAVWSKSRGPLESPWLGNEGGREGSRQTLSSVVNGEWCAVHWMICCTLPTSSSCSVVDDHIRRWNWELDFLFKGEIIASWM